MIGSGQENRKRCLVETPGPADLSEGRDSVGGLPLPERDHVAFSAPALGDPPAVGAIGCLTLACGCHEQNDSDAQAREASIPKLHGGLLRGFASVAPPRTSFCHCALRSNSEKCQGKESCLKGICDQARAERIRLLFRSYVVGLTRAAAVMMAAAGLCFSGCRADIFLAHMMGNLALGSTAIVVATVGLRGLGHRGHGDQRK